jgi:5-(carboxyamino)imidazole ribonucleotide synthase
MSVIEPGRMIGVLGGGQLGAMFLSAAQRLGYRVAVWDPDPDAPALRHADLPVAAAFTDPLALDRFAAAVSAVTYEWENIPYDVCVSLADRHMVRPAPAILRTVQNRIEQKTFLLSRQIPVAPFQAVQAEEDLHVNQRIGFPALCKTATSGYDGRGQWRLENKDHVARVREQLMREGGAPPKGGWIIEQLLAFEKELSVLVARGEDGESRAYPVAENIHEGGILRISRVPADLGADTTEKTIALAQSVVEAFDGVGVFCVELFLMPDGRLLVNEVAPRPHNSGHYTLDACTVSQFEQQVRAVCGLPLGESRLLSPAVMVNLIGEDLARATTQKELRILLDIPGAMLHVYGKKTSRPGRKMGHVTFVAEDIETAWTSAGMLRGALSHDAIAMS